MWGEGRGILVGFQGFDEGLSSEVFVADDGETFGEGPVVEIVVVGDGVAKVEDDGFGHFVLWEGWNC